MIEHYERNTDTETESHIRQDLQYGNVSSAKEWLRQISNNTLYNELKQVIQEYEGQYE